MRKIDLLFRIIPPVRIMLIAGTIFCMMLLVARIYFSSDLHYLFLVWNLFLAWIPLFISDSMVKLNATRFNIPKWVLFFSWILFFPNAPYIITDLFHLTPKNNIPLWFDLVLIVSFAWNGLILGFISLLKVQKILNTILPDRWSWLTICIILLLCAFGIDLGRFERWNSWDIITNPSALAIDIKDKIIHPFSHSRTVSVTLLFFLFLFTSYLTLFFLIKSQPHES